MRRTRSYERRRAEARLPAFKLLADFDWTWPRAISRSRVDELMSLAFIERKDNAVLVGGPGTGKTMIAANVAHQALLHGHTVRVEQATELLDSLAQITSRGELRRRLGILARPRLLVLDEIGYVTLESRHADILYAIVSRRYRHRSTLVTTSLGFAQWDRVFSSASSVAGTVDRLVHNAVVITIDSKSWRISHEAE